MSTNRGQGGYLVITDPNAGTVKERDTFTCFHCNNIVIVEYKADPESLGGFCRLCMKNVCKNCLGQGCLPFEKKLEQMEAQDRFRRSLEG